MDLGDETTCPECGQTLVISNTDPIELDFAPDDDEDEDEEEEEEELDGDEDDLEDEEEDEDGADWEEE